MPDNTTGPTRTDRFHENRKVSLFAWRPTFAWWRPRTRRSTGLLVTLSAGRVWAEVDARQNQRQRRCCADERERIAVKAQEAGECPLALKLLVPKNDESVSPPQRMILIPIPGDGSRNTNPVAREWVLLQRFRRSSRRRPENRPHCISLVPCWRVYRNTRAGVGTFSTPDDLPADADGPSPRDQRWSPAQQQPAVAA